MYEPQRLQHVLKDLTQHGNFVRREHALPSQEFVDWHPCPVRFPNLEYIESGHAVGYGFKLLGSVILTSILW